MARPRKALDIVRTFRGPRVLALEDLCHRLQCSRSTVLRRLAEHGYCSSYNDSGRYLTVPEVADFDSRGLWTWKAARFSRQGNLKGTVRYFVQDSEGGMTHREMAALLGVRVHNTLLDLVKEKQIRRERLGPTFVYVSGKAVVRSAQVRHRKAFLAQRRKLRPSSRQIIATLLELIKDPRAQRPQIVHRCQRAGVAISPGLVDAIFETYDLDKKRAP